MTSKGNGDDIINGVEGPVEQAWREYRDRMLRSFPLQVKIEAHLAFFGGAASVQEMFLAELERLIDQSGTIPCPEGELLVRVKEEIATWVHEVWDPVSARRNYFLQQVATPKI